MEIEIIEDPFPKIPEPKPLPDHLMPYTIIIDKRWRKALNNATYSERLLIQEVMHNVFSAFFSDKKYKDRPEKESKQ